MSIKHAHHETTGHHKCVQTLQMKDVPSCSMQAQHHC